MKIYAVGVVALLFALALPGCSRAPEAASADRQHVIIAGQLGNEYVTADQSGSVFVRLDLGTVDPPASERAPVNLALVLDTSGSMAGEPIEHARRAAVSMIDALNEGDRLAVVAFHSEAEVLLPSTELEERDERDEVKRRIETMKARGTTDMLGGLRAGLSAVEGHYDPKAINRIVLLGDGVPNAHEEAIEEFARQAGSRGITVTAMGLGLDYNESLMGRVAQLSGGRFRFVEDASKVAGFFRHEVLRLSHVYARNAVLELTPGPGTKIVDVVGQRATPTGEGMRLRVGDLSRDDQRQIVVELKHPAQRAGAAVELLDAVLRYDDALDGRGKLERRLDFGARATASKAELDAHRDTEVEETVARVKAAAATLGSIELARDGEPARAQQLLEHAAAEVEATAQKNGNAQLREQAQRMRRLQRQLPNAPTPAAAEPRPRAASSSATQKAVIRKEHDFAMSNL